MANRKKVLIYFPVADPSRVGIIELRQTYKYYSIEIVAAIQFGNEMFQTKCIISFFFVNLPFVIDSDNSN